ncbi:MAG: ribokinase [Comamonadaceae bacterium]|nr:MAG: ribokinase [Comamonadaceae bacterium]
MADVVCVASWNADLVSHVPRPVGRGETLMASAFSVSPGGKGSNAAVAAARQGASTALIARIGDDDFGRMGLALWKAEGISAAHVEVAVGERSGVAQILVYEDGDNSIAVFAGATAGMDAGHASRASALLKRCRVVMASCEVPFEVTQAAFRIAREVGAVTLLNPAPARPLPAGLLALVDVLTPNETEVLALAGMPPHGAVEDAAGLLLDLGTRAVLVTLGAAGCCLYRMGEAPLRLEGRSVAVADTIGAGDTFTGALAAAMARGEALPRAMQWANVAASLAVGRHGAIEGMPLKADVAALM